MNAAPADSLDENHLRIRDDLISRLGKRRSMSRSFGTFWRKNRLDNRDQVADSAVAGA